MIQRFQQVLRKRSVKVQCIACKRSLKRVVSVMHTVNPFNRDESGIPKSQARVSTDVLAELNKRCERLQSEGVICRKCEPTSSPDGEKKEGV